MNNSVKIPLRVGAGKAPVQFTKEMFPICSEHFTHVHDESYIQVLSLVTDTRYVFVAMGLAAPGNLSKVRNIIASIFNIPEENIMIHSKHVLSMPHVGGPHGIPSAPEDMIKNEERHGIHLTYDEASVYCKNERKMLDAIYDAIQKAALQALSSEQPATCGFGMCYSEANISRVIKTPDVWLQGTNPDGLTDRSVPVIRFDAADHSPIAILFNCNTAPGVLEHSVLSDGTQGISGDLAAAAENFINMQYEGVISIYTSGATGDQWQALRAVSDYIDKEGNVITKDLHEAGYDLVDILGTRLGAQVVKSAGQIRTEAIGNKIRLYHFVREYPGQEFRAMPVPGTLASNAATQELFPAGYDILQIDDNAIILCGVELDVSTSRIIKNSSPFKNTVIIGFANDTGNGYMVEKDFYDHRSYQSQKSHYASGTAERFREDIIHDLITIYDNGK